MPTNKQPATNKFFALHKVPQLAVMLLVVGGVAGILSYRSIHLKSSAQTPYSVTGYRLYGSADTPFPDGVGTTSLDSFATSANPFSYGTSGGNKTISSSASITHNGIKYHFDYGRLCYNNDVPRCPGGPSISYTQPIYITNPTNYADVWFSYAPDAPLVVVQANGYQGSVTVAYNSPLSISWGVSNATSCSASGNWSGSKSLAGGSESHNADTTAAGTKSYSLSCQGPGGSTTSSVSVTVQAPPTTTTPTTTTTTPTTTTTTTPGVTSNPVQPNTNKPALQGGSVRPTQPINVQSATPDTTPPSKPAEFEAHSDGQGVSIKLNWQASTDNSGSVSYQLERSGDQQQWQVLADSLGNTFYSDSDVKFSTHYFYRVRAADSSGNKSDYAAADTSTAAFTGNVSPDQEATLNGEGNTIKVVIPAGAVTEPASCAIESSRSLGPIVKGYRLVGGPFNILCKNADNSVISGFAKPVTITWTIQPPKNISGVPDYYGNESDWQKLTVTSWDSKSHTATFNLGKGTAFAAMGKVKTTPVTVKIILVLLGLAGIIAAVVFVLVRRNRRKLQSVYDDYRHKMSGV